MFRALISIFLVALLAGCSLFGERLTVHVKHVYAPIECGYPVPPVGINTLPVRPRAIQDQAGVYWVAITPKDYEHLALNTQESIRYIKDQKGVVSFYKQCIDTFNKQVEELNNEAK